MSNRKFYDARLAFPTKLVQAKGGDVEVYIIPDERKEEVLKFLYPFIQVPAMEDVLIDIHEDKKFIVKEFCVTREDNMNMLVSPYYFNSGGSVIDWVPEYWDEEE